MTYTAAVPFDAALVDARHVTRGAGSKAVGIVLRGSVFAAAALAFVGTSAVAVTLVAGWMASSRVQPQARLPAGPGSLILVPHDQVTAAVKRGQKPQHLAGSIVEGGTPITPAEKARPVIAETKPALPTVRSSHVPLPRAMPARLAQMRAETAAPALQAVARNEPSIEPNIEQKLVPELSVILPQRRPGSAPKIELAKAEPQTESKSEPAIATKLESKPIEIPKPSAVATIPAYIPAVLPDSVSRTAVYDITGSVVYMPDGSKLEAQSGLGPMMNDPRHTKVRMRGPTPPNVYVLTEREALFHGVRAVRMNPVYKERMYGRDGILAHSYLLGPNGQSNGCVSFKDYQKFLTAFLDGKVDKMVVVDSLRGMSWKTAAMQADGINASPRRYAGGYSRPTIMPRGGEPVSEPRYTAALGFAAERGAGTW